LPDVPLMALTATATERVRADIVKQLKLRDPRCYVASFNRPNLTYQVVPKTSAYQQTLALIRERPHESGIVYCASRKTAETLAKKLQADGVSAKPYHAGLDASDRANGQEEFLRDRVRVITATIAFGMGINKPNVRFVIHYDLPKNLESYYQETGRAGRDGLPGECVLLFSAADVVKQKRFIEEKSEPEQRIAHEQLRTMIGYAETRDCRRATLLRYFGEDWPPRTGENGSQKDRREVACKGCDNCLEPPETFDGTLLAQKFLSCVHRVRQKSGFPFGLNHIVDVLVGAETEPIRQRGHDQVSTYGIGADVPRQSWQAIGRELSRLGFVTTTPGKFATLQLTKTGLTTLRERSAVMLTKRAAPAPAKQPKQTTETGEYNEELFQHLRKVRRQLADERNVPAYIIFSDASLREMACSSPITLADFERVPGVGKQKLKDFGEVFTAAVAEYVANRGIMSGLLPNN